MKTIDIFHEFSRKTNKWSQRISAEAFINRAVRDSRIAIDDHGDTISFGVCRAINEEALAEFPEMHVEGGHIVYVDFIHTAHQDSVQWLIGELLDRFPECTHIAFHRKAKQNKQLKVYPIAKIQRLIRLIGE